jgi:hypothetical protein
MRTKLIVKCFGYYRTGVGGLDDLDSSEDDDDASDSGNSPSTSASDSGVPDCPVTGATSAYTSASQSRAEQTATPEAPRASSNSISGPSSPESPAEVQTQSQAEAAAFATSGSGEQKEVVPTEETFPKTDNLSVAQSSVNQAAVSFLMFHSRFVLLGPVTSLFNVFHFHYPPIHAPSLFWVIPNIKQLSL